MEQHVMTHAQWIAAGGWQPSAGGVTDDWVVIVGWDLTAEQAVWASWAPPTVDPATRLNPSVPAKDFR